VPETTCKIRARGHQCHVISERKVINVWCRLGYCNSPLFGISDGLLDAFSLYCTERCSAAGVGPQSAWARHTTVVAIALAPSSPTGHLLSRGANYSAIGWSGTTATSSWQEIQRRLCTQDGNFVHVGIPAYLQRRLQYVPCSSSGIPSRSLRSCLGRSCNSTLTASTTTCRL